VTALALLAGCALFPPVDGLGGGDASPTDATTPDAPQSDVPQSDAPSEAAVDASSDGDADAAPTCGWPGPTTGLVAYYPFEEGAGSAVHDCTSNHLDGTFVVAPAWTTGKKGGGIAVTSSAGCVDLGTPSQFQLSSLSVTAWIQVAGLPSIGSSGYVVGQAINADVSGWRFGAIQTDAGGFLQWDSTVTGTHYRVQTGAPPLSTWHALAVTFVPNGATQIFLDGTLAATQSGFAPISYDGAAMRIGCRSDGNNSFDGLIDEVRVYDHALSQSDVTALAQ